MTENIILQIISLFFVVIMALIALKSAKAAERSAKLSRESNVETKKERHVKNMPVLKVTIMDRRKNVQTPDYYKYDPATQDPRSKATIAKHTEHHFVEFRNIGKGIAYIDSIVFWVGNGAQEFDITLHEMEYENVLYHDEIGDAIRMNVYEPEDRTGEKDIRRVEIHYRDMWGHKITYTAKKEWKFDHSGLPFTRVKHYIRHEYNYPEELKYL